MRILSDTLSRAVRLLEVCTVLGFAAGTSAYAQDCFDDTDLQLVNGNIYTMDAEFSVVSAVRVANSRFVSVGESAPGPCTRVIDLDGRTVIPGLIDNHVHLLLTGIRPGHETRAVENARNVAEVQDAIRARAAGVPEGEFITAIGGIAARQFAEDRVTPSSFLSSSTAQARRTLWARYSWRAKALPLAWMASSLAVGSWARAQRLPRTRRTMRFRPWKRFGTSTIASRPLRP